MLIVNMSEPRTSFDVLKNFLKGFSQLVSNAPTYNEMKRRMRFDIGKQTVTSRCPPHATAPFKRFSLLAVLLISLQCVIMPKIAQGEVEAIPSLQADLKRLQEQEARLYEIRKKHTRDDFFRVSKEHARELADEGMRELERFDLSKAIDGLKETGSAKTLIDKILKQDASLQWLRKYHPTQYRKQYDEMVSTAEAYTKFGLEINSYSEQLGKADFSDERNLDNLIGQLKILKQGILIQQARIRTMPATPLANFDDGSNILFGTILASLELRRSSISRNAADRTLHREKALEEARNVVTGAANLRGLLSPTAKLFIQGTDAYMRLAYYLIAEERSNSLRLKASKIQSDALAHLNFQIMANSWNIDQTRKAIDRAERNIARTLLGVERKDSPRRHLSEPGGIKFNNLDADILAKRLDIDTVAYDPVKGEIIVAGRKGQQTINFEIFATTLRLALEKHEPFFSLDPVNAVEFDQQSAFIGERLYAKYFPNGDNTGFVRRLQRSKLRVNLDDGRTCYASTLADFDPNIEQAFQESLDGRLEKVFSPEWLRYTRVGQILYEADINIKAISGGLLVRKGEISLAPVWNIKGYRPGYLIPLPGDGAARVNFEIDGNLDENARKSDLISLDSIRPRLQYVARKPGTNIDLESTPVHTAVKTHFSENWREYVDAVPEFAELLTVYRAYVAARLLVQRNPGLAERILRMGDVPKLDINTLYDTPARPIFACLQNGRLMRLPTSDNRYFVLGGSLFGGTMFKFRNVKYETPNKPGDDLTLALMKPSVRIGNLLETNDRLAIALNFADEPLPVLAQWRLLALTLAIGGVLILTAFLKFVLWARKAGESAICVHCRKVHRWAETVGAICDNAAIGGVVFICALPLVVADYRSEPTLVQTVTAIAMLAVVPMLLGFAGWALNRLMQTLRNGAAIRVLETHWIGTGARYGGSALAVWLFAEGVNEHALSERIISLSPEVGELLLLELGSMEVLRAALFVILAAAIGSFVVRWIWPFVRGSRPLPLGIAHAQNPH